MQPVLCVYVNVCLRAMCAAVGKISHLNTKTWGLRRSKYQRPPFYLLPAAPYLALSSRASRALPWAVSRDTRHE